MSACEQPLRVAYLLERYPNASETFIANEVRRVHECGGEVTVFALQKGDRGVDAGVPAVYAQDAPTEDPLAGLAFALRASRRAWAFGAGAPRALACALRRRTVLRFFGAEARQRDIRHLHAHFGGLPTLVALLLASADERLTVSFSVHARDIWAGGEALGRKVRRARLCLACTAANAERLRSLAGPQCRSKILHVYHGTDLARFPFRPRAEAASPPRVAAVGRMVPKKGFDVLLRALALLRGRRDVACEFVGDGPLEADLRALAGELGLEGSVRFSGWLPYEQMPGVYGRADVLVVPSVQAPDGDRDGLPNVVVEALASGTPVVAAALSGIPEAVRDGETGLLCPPGDARALADALDRMLTDPALRARVAAAGRRLAEERFDCRKNGRAVYEALRGAARLEASECF